MFVLWRYDSDSLLFMCLAIESMSATLASVGVSPLEDGRSGVDSTIDSTLAVLGARNIP